METAFSISQPESKGRRSPYLWVMVTAHSSSTQTSLSVTAITALGWAISTATESLIWLLLMMLIIPCLFCSGRPTGPFNLMWSSQLVINLHLSSQETLTVTVN